MKSLSPLLFLFILSACQATPTPLPPSPLPSLTPSATPSPTHTPTARPTHTRTALPTPTDTATPTPSRPWRIMPLGDSLTSGTYPGRVHSYRGYLEALLREAGYAFDLTGTQSRLAHGGTDPDHEGHSGYSIGPDQARFCELCSTANLYDHLEEFLSSEPDIILLLTGINDLLPLEQRPVLPEEAPAKLANLVARIQELRPQAYIFVASLTPINYMDSAELPYYDEINQMAEKLGNQDAEDRVYFVDLNRQMEATIDRSADFADGIHLAEGGARKMAQVWFKALVSSGVLGKPDRSYGGEVFPTTSGTKNARMAMPSSGSKGGRLSAG